MNVAQGARVNHMAALAVLTAAVAGGCGLEQIPLVTRQGAIEGGHPKLNAMANLIASWAREQFNGPERPARAWYAAAIWPTAQCVGWEDELGLEVSGQRYSVPFSVMFSGETLDRAYVAVLFEASVSEDGTAMKRKAHLLFWEGNTWTPQSFLEQFPADRRKTRSGQEGQEPTRGQEGDRTRNEPRLRLDRSRLK